MNSHLYCRIPSQILHRSCQQEHVYVIFRCLASEQCHKQNRSSSVVDKISAIPHPKSKLRLFEYAVPLNETEYERKFRERRVQIQNLNHKYWSRINTEFEEKRKEYIDKVLKNKPRNLHEGIDFTSPQTHEELAQFYKRFLDENHRRYIDYNFQWYRNNISLLWPSFVVWLIRLRRKLLK